MSLVEQTQNFLILELRKFFGGLPPYTAPKVPFAIPSDLVYIEAGPGQPTDASKLVIADEENFTDRRIPCIILTGESGPTMELGLGQHGLKTYQTDELNKNLCTAVNAATTQPGNMATDFCAGQTVDDYVLQFGDRLLLNWQADPTTNGVYVVQASGAPVRSSDFNTSAQFLYLSTFQVVSGAVNGDQYFSQDTPNNTTQPFILGTTALAYNNRGLNILRWDERVGAQEITINMAIRGQTTSQRIRLAELVKIAMANKRFVRGQIEKMNVNAMPPFVRDGGLVEEFDMSAGSKMIYTSNLSMQFLCQWNSRELLTSFKIDNIVIDKPGF
jgi:hypothetical protein